MRSKYTADIEVPEFNTLEQFINWCQDSLVQEILKKKPESLSQLASHPNVKPWLNEFFNASRCVKTSTTTPPESETDRLRILTMSNPEDKAFLEEVIAQFAEKGVIVEEVKPKQKTEGIEGIRQKAEEETEEKTKEELKSFGRYRILRKLAEGGGYFEEVRVVSDTRREVEGMRRRITILRVRM